MTYLKNPYICTLCKNTGRQMKKLILMLTGCLLSGSLFIARAGHIEGNETAEEERKPAGTMAYRGFIGGMMLHTGYVSSRDITVASPAAGSRTLAVGGAPFGIGGAIRFLFGKHLRVGAEGYVSTLTYGEYHSHAKTGWGGLLADSAWKVGSRCRLFVGGTVGGGSQTNTVILSSVADDYVAEDFISYRKYGFMAVAPFAGVEVAVNRKVNVVFKADWLLNVTNPEDDFVSGPRIYVGFMFGHTD